MLISVVSEVFIACKNNNFLKDKNFIRGYSDFFLFIKL